MKFKLLMNIKIAGIYGIFMSKSSTKILQRYPFRAVKIFKRKRVGQTVQFQNNKFSSVSLNELITKARESILLKAVNLMTAGSELRKQV